LEHASSIDCINQSMIFPILNTVFPHNPSKQKQKMLFLDRKIFSSLDILLTFPIFLPELRNEKTVSSRLKISKQKFPFSLYRDRQDNNKILTNQIA